MPEELVHVMYINNLSKGEFMQDAMTYILYGREKMFHFHGWECDKNSLIKLFHQEAFK